MANTSRSQFPRRTKVPIQSAKYWVKEKDRYLRQLLIGDIQEQTGRPLVVYFSQLNQAISSSDADDLAEIISGVEEDTADILLNTPGGDVDSTEKIITVLKKKFKEYRVIVPSRAKSAGTVISLSASEILLGINSELGPIDPQFAVNGGMIPCEVIASDTAIPIHVRQMAERAIMRMKQLATNLISAGIMAGKSPTEVQELVQKISSYMSHGAVIDFDEAMALGLKVNYLDPSDDLWKRLWLLHNMYEYDCTAKSLGKIFEGYKYSLSRPHVT